MVNFKEPQTKALIQNIYYYLVKYLLNFKRNWINIFYFKRGNNCIKPNIHESDPNNIFVVGFVIGILSISNSFLLCLVPKIISMRPNTKKIIPTSQGKIISIFKLFIKNLN